MEISETQRRNTQVPSGSRILTHSQIQTTDNLSKMNSKYNHYFTFTIENKNKVARCELCVKNKLNVEIKMKNSNTSGLKWHMKKCHKNEFTQNFTNPVRQPTIVNMFQVENKEKGVGDIIFYSV